jgi:hypothetical protein
MADRRWITLNTIISIECLIMKKSLVSVFSGLAAGVALMAAAPAPAQAHGHWSLNIGVGGFGYYQPPIVYAPAPAYYPPPAVVYAPAPVYPAPQPVVEYYSAPPVYYAPVYPRYEPYPVYRNGYRRNHREYRDYSRR